MNQLIQLIQPQLLPLIGTLILLAATGFDFFLSHDDFPQNTVRDSLLNYTQRRYEKLRFTGAFVPYGLGLLLGHFYHFPGSENLLGWLFPPGGYHKVITAISIGLILTVATHFINRDHPIGGRLVPWIALFGFIIGIVVWPIGTVIPSF